MGKVLDKFNQLLSSGDDMRVMVFRGKLTPLGGIPASEFRYTDSGVAYFRGNIAPETVITKRDGTQFTLNSHLPIYAFNDVALDLAPTSEGSRVLILAEFNKKKSRDGKQYYTEGMVVAAEILEQPTKDFDDVPF